MGKDKDYPFYGGTPAHQKHSGTSRAAAESIQPKAKTQRDKVRDYVKGERGNGAIRHEIQDALGLTESSVNPRLTELEEIGSVRKVHELVEEGIVDKGDYPEKRPTGTRNNMANVYLYCKPPVPQPPEKRPRRGQVKALKAKVEELTAENARLRRELRDLKKPKSSKKRVPFDQLSGGGR